MSALPPPQVRDRQIVPQKFIGSLDGNDRRTYFRSEFEQARALG